MSAETLYCPENIDLFKQKALHWASLHKTACYFDSNGYDDPYSAFDTLIAIDSRAELSATSGKAFAGLQSFLNSYNDWALGFFSYDLKNELENLESKNLDRLNFPDLFFFIPRHLLLIKGNEVRVLSNEGLELVDKINAVIIEPTQAVNVDIETRLDRQAYIEKVNKLRQHILRGDVYEVNFCQEFFAENVDINPVSVFSELNRISPTPFANFFKQGDRYIISATPERFLSRRGQKLISQPIKGTATRCSDKDEDIRIRENLRNDPKERAENVMIVDLVRNDLTKSAVPGTVRVEELLAIYSFRQVHQMISTVVCEANPELAITEVVKNTFPMGSMTGAPKIKAMELIEQFEETKRGIYSGAVGYFSPTGDFDFNVIIRTLLYNRNNKYLSFHTGSAITYDSDPIKEYEECLLKAKAIFKVLGPSAAHSG